MVRRTYIMEEKLFWRQFLKRAKNRKPTKEAFQEAIDRSDCFRHGPFGEFVRPIPAGVDPNNMGKGLLSEAKDAYVLELDFGEFVRARKWTRADFTRRRIRSKLTPEVIQKIHAANTIHASQHTGYPETC